MPGVTYVNRYDIPDNDAINFLKGMGVGGTVQGWRCSCGTFNTPDSCCCKNCGNRMA